MGGSLIVGRGTTADDALADYREQARQAEEELCLYADSEPEIVLDKGQYLAVGHVHT